MKKIIALAAFALAMCTQASAQLTWNNSTGGTVFVTAYAYITSCDPATYLDNATFQIPPGSSSINLAAMPAVWSGSVVPNSGNFEIEYVVVSKDLSCNAPSYGMYLGSGCTPSGDYYHDVATIGDPNCHNDAACISIYNNGTDCNGFADGEAIVVEFTPNGASPNIDIHW